MHTKSSQLFQIECMRLPDHPMHVYARMMVNMYLVSRYGHRVNKHKRRIAVALDRLDGERL